MFPSNPAPRTQFLNCPLECRILGVKRTIFYDQVCLATRSFDPVWYLVATHHQVHVTGLAQYDC